MKWKQNWSSFLTIVSLSKIRITNCWSRGTSVLYSRILYPQNEFLMLLNPSFWRVSWLLNCYFVLKSKPVKAVFGYLSLKKHKKGYFVLIPFISNEKLLLFDSHDLDFRTLTEKSCKNYGNNANSLAKGYCLLFETIQ